MFLDNYRSTQINNFCNAQNINDHLSQEILAFVNMCYEPEHGQQWEVKNNQLHEILFANQELKNVLQNAYIQNQNNFNDIFGNATVVIRDHVDSYSQELLGEQVDNF
jgi:hypothetical protein